MEPPICCSGLPSAIRSRVKNCMSYSRFTPLGAPSEIGSSSFSRSIDAIEHQRYHSVLRALGRTNESRHGPEMPLDEADNSRPPGPAGSPNPSNLTRMPYGRALPGPPICATYPGVPRDQDFEGHRASASQERVSLLAAVAE